MEGNGLQDLLHCLDLLELRSGSGRRRMLQGQGQSGRGFFEVRAEQDKDPQRSLSVRRGQC